MSRKLLFFILFFGLSSLVGFSAPQDYFRIARISYLEGHVSFQHTNEVDWSAASINMALQPGDRIYTGDTGRAEIEFDDGSVLRLAEKTDVELLTMNEQLIQLRALLGLCSLTSRSSVGFEINTPAAAFTTLERGSYRFDIAQNGDSDGIVRKGELEAVNNRMTRRVQSGELLHVPAAANENEVVARYNQRDPWDEWNDRRDADLTSYASRSYLPDYVYVGVSDLDRYGRWAMVDGYGYGWVPRVSVGWSPYWDGRWCYRPYWGWTWVSYEPWGWLPYHYGRWYHSVSVGWCWLPGASFSFHFWSPGLVRFYHGHDRVSWYALGPGDYYNVNNYYYNHTYSYYVNNLRLQQHRGPENLLNRNSPGAFRSVGLDQFVEGRGLGRIESPGNSQDILRNSRIVTGALDVRPTPRSYAPVPDRTVVRPVDSPGRAVFVRNEPAVNAPGDRFERVARPVTGQPAGRAVAGGRTEMPATTTGRQAGGAIQVVPSQVGARNVVVPDSGSAGVRANPNSTSRTGNANAAGTGRTVVVPRNTDPGAQVPTTRQTGRVTQEQPARRVETPARQSGSEPGRIQRTEPPAASRQPQTQTPARSPRQDPAQPPANSPVKKEPVNKAPENNMASGYAPREYGAGRWLGSQIQTARPASTTGGSAVTSNAGRYSGATAQSNVRSAAPQGAASPYGRTAVSRNTVQPQRSYGSVVPQNSYDAGRATAARQFPTPSRSVTTATSRSFGSVVPRSQGNSAGQPSIVRSAPAASRASASRSAGARSASPRKR